MLDLRVYRAAFVPALLAFVITAFSLGSPPRAATTTLAPDAFQGSRAFGSLGRLADAYPARRPGGPGDEALARSVAAQMRATGLQVTSDRFSGRTIDGDRTLTNVVGVRPGSLTSASSSSPTATPPLAAARRHCRARPPCSSWRACTAAVRCGARSCSSRPAAAQAAMPERGSSRVILVGRSTA